MILKLCILGSNSAKPAFNRHPSAQLLQVEEGYYLIDCGEGTQMQLMRYRYKSSKICRIFITHLHGDHFLGLPGLLDSFVLSGRVAPIHLYGPKGVDDILRFHFQLTGGGLSFPLHFQEVPTHEASIILETERISVQSIPLEHRVPCAGYIFREKEKERNILSEKIKQYNIPYPAIRAIKKGADFETDSGELIANELLTKAPPKPLSYAYCSDTSYSEFLLPYLHKIDLLYHESTYLNDCASMAAERGHTTAAEAARLAQKAEVRQLLLGHYSSRYRDLQPFLDESRPIFASTYLSKEGQEWEIGRLVE